MIVKPIPLSWLVHSIEYKHYEGKDHYDEAVYSAPIVIENVRVEFIDSFQRSKLSEDNVFNGVIFVDSVNSKPLPEHFEKGSKIIFDGQELTLKTTIAYPYPKSSEIRHFELEVI